jgi:DNA ligase D-like protein (predicted ligase)
MLSLPRFIEPMLARPAEPFDSDLYLYEIKWDGFRAIAYIDDAGAYRLLGRKRTEFKRQFPELGVLASLPPGTAIDGEIVAMVDGKPDFASLLQREQSPTVRSRPRPVTFVAFDLLYCDFESRMKEPCEARREKLQQILEPCRSPRIELSRSVVGDGLAYFESVCKMGLEGVIAKRRDSSYEPGHRSGAWLKFKRRNSLLCAIIGYQPSEARPLRSLIIAAPVEGVLQCVGQVGSGISQQLLEKLLEMLKARECPKPIIPCNIKGRWVKPGLYCTVSYAEWTSTKQLRAPVFESLHVK